MSFGILNSICSKPDPFKNRLALALDGLVLVSIATISTLALLQIGNLSQAKIYICISGGVLASGIIASDILGYYKSKQNFKVFYREQFNYRIQTAIVDESQVSYFRDLSVPWHQVFGSLYLGSFSGFIQTTDIPKISVQHGSEVLLVDNVNNPQQFKTIITANDIISESIKYYCSQKNINQAQLETYFQKKGITWFNLAVSDDKNWELLVAQCRRLNGKESENPFEGLFQEFDKAVFYERGSHKILVHCHNGQSLSAALIVAYMINRLGVTAEEGFRYLKSVRCCVKPIFMRELEGK